MRIDGNVAGTGNYYGLAGKALALDLEHFFRKIAKAIAGGLNSIETAMEGERLARQHAGKFVAQPLVLAEQVADFPCAHADIAGRHIGVRADIFVQLVHKALAKVHDFAVRLALGVKIAAALCTADRKSGQRVFEDLLKAEELDDALVNRWVKAKPTLIRADCVAELNAIADVDANAAAVIHPRDTESDQPVGLDKPVQNGSVHILGVSLQHGGQRPEYLSDGLQKFRLVRIVAVYVFHYGM